MPGRINDPRDLEDWIVKIEQRLRQLEARRIDAMEGLEQDHATKQMRARISGDSGNAAAIGEDGGIFAADTITTAADHTPLFLEKFTTANQNITNGADNLVTWGGTDVVGTWTSDATSITIPQDGRYLVTFQWQWASSAAGVRAAHMTVNSVTVATGSRFGCTVNVTTTNETTQGFADHSQFVSGDVLRMYVFQNSGGTLGGGGPYFGDIRGRWTVARWGDAYPPALTQTTA